MGIRGNAAHLSSISIAIILLWRHTDAVTASAQLKHEHPGIALID
jgi:hypothetical protein